MLDKMKQLMEMKKQADRIKKELEATRVDIKEVNGINIVIDGTHNFHAVEIDAEHLNPENKGQFEADLLKSLNAAIQKSQAVAAQKMNSVLPGL